MLSRELETLAEIFAPWAENGRGAKFEYDLCQHLVDTLSDMARQARALEGQPEPLVLIPILHTSGAR